MNKTSQNDSSSAFRQAVFIALIEQAKTNPDPLRNFLLDLLGRKSQSDNEKLGWLLTDKTSFVVFYKLLKTHECISGDFEFFKTHFECTEQPNDKIIWQANLNELVYLFARLREEGVIPLHKNPHVLLQENFLDKYKRPIKAGSLRTLLEKGIKNSDRIRIIDDIIDNVLSCKTNMVNAVDGGRLQP